MQRPAHSKCPLQAASSCTGCSEAAAAAAPSTPPPASSYVLFMYLHVLPLLRTPSPPSHSLTLPSNAAAMLADCAVNCPSRRFYSNTYTDAEKQDAINLFLGNYQPSPSLPPLWELGDDYHLHSGAACTSSSSSSSSSSSASK